MEVVGHRGAAGEAPENTLAGCLHAYQRGARHLEIDLRLSADDQLVVVHDKTVDRTTFSSGAINQFTSAELGRMDARASGAPWPNKRKTGIPRLNRLLAECRRFRSIQLEVKSDTRPALKQVALRLADLLPAGAAARGRIVTSSNPFIIDYLAGVAPHLKRGLVVEKKAGIADALALGCDLCVLNWRLCNPRTVSRLQGAGVQVSAWTVNDASVVRQLHAMKIESVITDYPSMALPLVAALKRKGE